MLFKYKFYKIIIIYIQFYFISRLQVMLVLLIYWKNLWKMHIILTKTYSLFKKII